MDCNGLWCWDYKKVGGKPWLHLEVEDRRSTVTGVRSWESFNSSGLFFALSEKNSCQHQTTYLKRCGNPRERLYTGLLKLCLRRHREQTCGHGMRGRGWGELREERVNTDTVIHLGLESRITYLYRSSCKACIISE